MWHVAGWLILLALNLQHTTDAEDLWQGKCMPPCTCDQSHFADLLVATQWLPNKASASTTESPLSTNQATYDDNDQELGEVLKIAMCVFQRGTDPQLVLGLLPTDIQVLTILQGRDSGRIILEADYFQDFQQLMVLDVQGFQPSENSWEAFLVLRNDALQPLLSLQYLNLQNIKLLGHEVPDNRLHPTERNTRKRRIVLLKPSENDIPLVSYQEYKQEMERAGLTTFAGLSKLLMLRVYACDLREVNWEMFQGLGKLQYLSLESNNLLFVPEFVFYGTPHLKSLSLAGNQLLSLQDTALAGLLELDRLDLSKNNFSHLSELSLPPFPALRTADFRNNPVEAVFPSTFEVMNATFVLYLGGETSPLNLLPNSFLGLSSLKKLDILNVGVPLLDRELLRGMPQLKTLVMTGSIRSIAFDAFLEVPKLEYLELNNCNITTVSMDAFYGLHGLISLDLSHNLLTSLPPGVFDQQFSLKELLLSNNRLTELPSNIFDRVPAKMIRLEHNPWHCSCAMREWQPSAVNKVKQEGTIEGSCRFFEDKGVGCRRSKVERYMYDKRVSPKCTTPIKYINWNVFHVLRKELHCKNKFKSNKKAYLKKKVEDYKKSMEPERTRNANRTLEKVLDGIINNKGTKYALPAVTEAALSVNVLVNSTKPPQVSTDANLTPTKAVEVENLSTSSREVTSLHSRMPPSEGEDTKVLTLAQSIVQPSSDLAETQENNYDSEVKKIHVGNTDFQSAINESTGNVNDSTETAFSASTIQAQEAKKLTVKNKVTPIPLTVRKIEVKSSSGESLGTVKDSSITKKNKQQLNKQYEREAKSSLKQKMKSENVAFGQLESPEKDLKKALKLDMEKKRNEKRKRVGQ